MIRKFILFFILIFIAFWFAGAYFIRLKTLDILKQLESDNIKISYQDIKISGFPSIWQIKIVQPRIKLVDHIGVYELNIEHLQFLFTASFDKIKLLLDKELHYIQVIREQKKQYKICSEDKINIILKLEQPLYKIIGNSKLISIIKSLEFNNHLLSVIHNDESIFTIKNLVILGTNNLLFNSEDFFVQVKAIYEGKNGILNFNSVFIDFEGMFKYIINNENNLGYDKNFTISKLRLDFGDADIDLHGDLVLVKNKSPQGQFFVNLHHYETVIDKIIPDNFIISNSLFKNLVSRAIVSNNTDTEAKISNDVVQLNIVFSDKGINIGSIKLLDFKAKASD